MEQYESSLEALKECLQRESKSLEAMNLAGQTYCKLGIKSKAIKMYKKVLKIAPGHKAATNALKKIKIN
jgi:tetratricopeptide (TPR) repeat protein